MSTFKRRLEALEALQDGKCKDCWEQLISVATDYHVGLERHGLSEAAARRHIFYPADATDDERAQAEAAREHLQDEIAALNETQQRWDALRPGCETWFTRHTGGTPDEY